MRMSLGIKLNNPFNVRYSPLNKWKGLKGQEKGFCEFISIEYGLRAGIILLKNYVQKHHLHTIEDILHKYAPVTENPTYSYISYVRSFLRSNGCNPDYIEFNTRGFLLMCVAMCNFESWYRTSEWELYNIIVKFKIK